MKKYSITLILTVLFCTFLHSDIIYLKNGKTIEGRIERKTEQKIYIKSQGMTFTLNRYEIDRIEQKKTRFEIYKKALKKIDSSSADQNFKLGNWCEKNGLSAYAKQHWKKTIEIDPDHTEARKALGFELFEGTWMTRTQVMKKKGFVLFEKKWVTPGERDTILYERAVHTYLPEIKPYNKEARQTAVAGLLAFGAQGACAVLEKLLPMKQELLSRYRNETIPPVNSAFASFRELRKKLTESQKKTLAAIGTPGMYKQELSNIELHKQYRDAFKAVDTAFKNGDSVRNELTAIDDLILRANKTAGKENGPSLKKELMKDVDTAGLSLYKKEDARMKRDARIMAYNKQLDYPNENETTAARLYNEYRILVGRVPFIVEKCLTTAARSHSREMTELDYFGHVSPVAKNKTYVMRVKNAGYDGSARGENCASYPTARAAVAGWLHSTPHHKNLSKKSANELGMGYAGVYTANFGHSRKKRIPAGFKTDSNTADISYDYYIAVWNNPRKKRKK